MYSNKKAIKTSLGRLQALGGQKQGNQLLSSLGGKSKITIKKSTKTSK